MCCGLLGVVGGWGVSVRRQATGDRRRGATARITVDRTRYSTGRALDVGCVLFRTSLMCSTFYYTPNSSFQSMYLTFVILDSENSEYIKDEELLLTSTIWLQKFNVTVVVEESRRRDLFYLPR